MKRALWALPVALILFLSVHGESVAAERDGPYTFHLAGDGAVVDDYELSGDEATPRIIVVPDTLGGQPVVSIAFNAFNNSELAYDGAKVDALILPDTVLYLEESAFQCCHGVQSIIFPASMETIPEGSFSHVSACMIVSRDNPNFVVRDGFLIDERIATLLYSPWREGRCYSVTLPAVRRIGESSMDNLYWCSEVILPDILESIGSFAFYGMPYLKALAIPDSVIHMDEYTFYDSTLEKLRISANVTEIPAYFCDSSDLKELTLPPRLKTIGEFAFSMADIHEITLPETTEFVGYMAFPDQTHVTCLNPHAHFETQNEYEARMMSKRDE